MDLRALIKDFTNRIASIVQRDSMDRARATIEKVFGKGRPGRPLKGAALATGRARKKPPRQLCPVPRCKNVAAPVFGMVCGEHKDVSKAKIKKYREARRAKKAKAA